jgi:uncharacterized protein YjbJ (UPF0337 family)
MAMRKRTAKESAMENRGKGIVKQMKGNVKEAVGEISGDSRTRRRGKADRIAGRVQEAVGDAVDPGNKRRR